MEPLPSQTFSIPRAQKPERFRLTGLRNTDIKFIIWWEGENEYFIWEKNWGSHKGR